MIAVIFDSSVLSADFWINTGITVGLAGLVVLGLQLNTGSTGIINLAPSGFMALGAYVMALLVTRVHLPFGVAVVCGVGASVAIGVVIGVAAVRIGVHYFAIATIAFASIVVAVVTNASGLTGGTRGLYGFDGGWATLSSDIGDLLSHVGLTGSPLLPLLVVTWILLLALLVLIRYLARSPWGRSLEALREDEHAAAALGVNALALKLQSIGIASGLGSLAGTIFALQVKYLAPTEFDGTTTIFAYAALLLGGLGSYVGATLGTVIVFAALELMRFLAVPLSTDQLASVRFIVVGVLLLLLCILRPQGLFGSRAEMAARRE